MLGVDRTCEAALACDWRRGACEEVAKRVAGVETACCEEELECDCEFVEAAEKVCEWLDI